MRSFFRKEKPKPKTFFDDFNKAIVDDLRKVDIYYTDSQWAINLIKTNNIIITINLADDMTEIQMITYVNPLLRVLPQGVLNIETRAYHIYS